MRKLAEIFIIAISGFKRLMLCLLVMLLAMAMVVAPLSYHPLLADDQSDALYNSYWQTLQEYYQLSQALKQSQEEKQQARQAYELAQQLEHEKTDKLLASIQSLDLKSRELQAVFSAWQSVSDEYENNSSELTRRLILQVLLVRTDSFEEFNSGKEDVSNSVEELEDAKEEVIDEQDEYIDAIEEEEEVQEEIETWEEEKEEEYEEVIEEPEPPPEEEEECDCPDDPYDPKPSEGEGGGEVPSSQSASTVMLQGQHLIFPGKTNHDAALTRTSAIP